MRSSFIHVCSKKKEEYNQCKALRTFSAGPYVQCRTACSMQGRTFNAGLLRSEKGRTFMAGRARLRPIRLGPVSQAKKNLIEIFATWANPSPAGDAFTQTRLMPTFVVAARFPTKHRWPKAGDVWLKGRLKVQGGCFGVSVFRCFGVSVFRCSGVQVFSRSGLTRIGSTRPLAYVEKIRIGLSRA